MANIDLVPLKSNPFRVVEQQTRKAILALVDAEEAEMLEAMVEESKPSVPEDYWDLNRLIVTPFRYPPLNYGSRFGSRTERGIWYGSEDIRTALGEKSFYQFRFFEDSPEMKKGRRSYVFDWTSFQATVAARRAIDLCSRKFARTRSRHSSPTTYMHSQSFGTEFRVKRGQAIRFHSARVPAGKNVAVFDPGVLSDPKNQCHWNARWDSDTISIRAYNSDETPERFEFKREDFLVKCVFPMISG